MPGQVALSSVAKASVTDAMTAFAVYEDSVNEVNRALQQRQEENVAADKAAKAERRKRDRLAKSNREKRTQQAVLGVETLIALAQQPSIQELMRQRTHYRGPLNASFHFYLATSTYDERAPDQAAITVSPTSIEIEWGVPDADDVRRLSIALDAAERTIRRKLGEIADAYPCERPLAYPKLDKWKVRDPDEGAGIVFQVLVDCATPAKFEKYLVVSLAHVAEDVKNWSKLPRW